MKKSIILLIFLTVLSNISFSKNYQPSINSPYTVIKVQIPFNGNNIGSWVWNTGVFNQDLRTNNTPGFEWPRGTGKFAMFTTGLSMGAYIDTSLRLASISYQGEFAPGYVLSGAPVTNANFKLYRIVRGDTASTNPDYANWGLMVPYGAPYEDVNNNGTFELFIDRPGVKNASQTVFECITDGFPENHTASEGFSGGTLPAMSEMHLTFWCYDNITSMADVQFAKFEVINKNTVRWDSTFFAVIADPDLGDGNDDYIGCDRTRDLGYCYNASNQDGDGSGKTYGAHPPAVGIDLLKGARINGQPQPNIGMSSFVYFSNPGSGGVPCEQDPSSDPIQAYNYLRGVKKDGTPWLNAYQFPPTITKFCYTGDPESGSQWIEYFGMIKNCGGITTGNTESSPPGDRRFVLSSGSNLLSMNPGDTQKFVVAQLVARGTTNRNSVTKLKQLDDAVQTFYDNNYNVGINNISNEVPEKFSLYQNYPNPFNPSTNIKFEIAKSDFVNLTVFDLSGRVVEELVNEKLNEGIYEVSFTAKNISSGIYFYRLSSANFTQTNRMILIK